MDFKKRAFIEAYRASLGVIVHACKAAEISRGTYYNWMDNDPEFRAEVEAVNEESIDFAENALKKKIRDGDTTAIIFYLKTRGKSRGYIERTEIDATMSEKQKELEELAMKFYTEE